MALQPVVQGTDQSGKAATKMLQELQNLRISVVAGGAADTDLTCAGILYTAAAIADGTADTIIAILEQDATSGVIAPQVDRVGEAQAGTVAARIQLATTATTGKNLLVVWYEKP